MFLQFVLHVFSFHYIIYSREDGNQSYLIVFIVDTFETESEPVDVDGSPDGWYLTTYLILILSTHLLPWSDFKADPFSQLSYLGQYRLTNPDGTGTSH